LAKTDERLIGHIREKARYGDGLTMFSVPSKETMIWLEEGM
jgi:hypothetical protein